MPSGRHPVYVGTFEADSPEAVPDWYVASMLFVPLAEPEWIAGAQHWIEDDTSVPLPVTDYVVLSDLEAWRLPADPIQGSRPMQVFLRDVEAAPRTGSSAPRASGPAASCTTRAG